MSDDTNDKDRWRKVPDPQFQGRVRMDRAGNIEKLHMCISPVSGMRWLEVEQEDGWCKIDRTRYEASVLFKSTWGPSPSP